MPTRGRCTQWSGNSAVMVHNLFSQALSSSNWHFLDSMELMHPDCERQEKGCGGEREETSHALEEGRIKILEEDNRDILEEL